MKEIHLSKGYKAFIDDEYFEEVSHRKWHYEHGYARSAYPTKVYLHQFVTDLKGKDGLFADHIDGNKLNNQISNLRVSNKQQNGANRGLNKNNTSGFKGVGWHKQAKKWRAHIDVSGKHRSLGLYTNIHDAIEAYNNAARKYFGEFAYLNIL